MTDLIHNAFAYAVSVQLKGAISLIAVMAEPEPTEKVLKRVKPAFGPRNLVAVPITCVDYSDYIIHNGVAFSGSLVRHVSRRRRLPSSVSIARRGPGQNEQEDRRTCACQEGAQLYLSDGNGDPKDGADRAFDENPRSIASLRGLYSAPTRRGLGTIFSVATATLQWALLSGMLAAMTAHDRLRHLAHCSTRLRSPWPDRVVQNSDGRSCPCLQFWRAHHGVGPANPH